MTQSLTDPGNVHILMDSLCSIYMIRKRLRHPEKMKQCKHRDLLLAIVASTNARSLSLLADLHTTIGKDKLHVGIPLADRGATGVAEASD